MRWSGEDETVALEGLANGTPLRKRAKNSSSNNTGIPSSPMSCNSSTHPFTVSNSSISSPVPVPGASPTGTTHDRRRRNEGSVKKTTSKKAAAAQALQQEIEKGFGDGVDLLHSLANSAEHIDTFEEQVYQNDFLTNLHSNKRQKTSNNKRNISKITDNMIFEEKDQDYQRAHEECAAIISDMKSLSSNNTPNTAVTKRTQRKSSNVSNLNSNTHSLLSMTAMQLPNNTTHHGVLDATGNSLAAAAFGTPNAQGGISGGLNDICLALWSAAPLQNHHHSNSYDQADDIIIGSPAYRIGAASAPHPSMYSKYKKPIQKNKTDCSMKTSTIGAIEEGMEDAAEGEEECDGGGVTLNMDVGDYSATTTTGTTGTTTTDTTATTGKTNRCDSSTDEQEGHEDEDTQEEVYRLPTTEDTAAAVMTACVSPCTESLVEKGGDSSSSSMAVSESECEHGK